jgi:hypothetical protein
MRNLTQRSGSNKISKIKVHKKQLVTTQIADFVPLRRATPTTGVLPDAFKID